MSRGTTVVRRAAKVIVGVVLLVWSLAPIYWAVVVSLSTPSAITSQPPQWIPHPVSLAYYRSLLDRTSTVSAQFLDALRNSLIEAVGTTALTVLTATLAAYAFARWRAPGSYALFLVIIGTLALPVYAVLIPLFEFATSTGQIDSYQIVILILTSSFLPLAIWLLRSHIASLPTDVEDAARVDGARTLTLLTRIVAPLVAPGVATAAVITFLSAWAAFLIPLTFAPTTKAAPVTVLITQFTTRYSENYGLQAATGILALIPPVLVAIWANRYLLAGLLRGASR